MQVGIDLDNTLISLDGLFLKTALSRGLVPAGFSENKTAIRDYLRARHQEDLWTEMQGYVYGALLPDAPAFPGVVEFFTACRRKQVPVCIISHKTLTPFAGSSYNLHEAAMEWLRRQRFFTDLGLAENAVFLEPTKGGKLQRIASTGCSHFVDDLPEFLLEPSFPPEVSRILFDPQRLHANVSASRLIRLGSWKEILACLWPGPKA